MFSRDYIFTVHFHFFPHAVCLPRILSGCHLLASLHHFPLIVFVILFSFYLSSAVLPDSDFKYRCFLLVACIAIFPFVFCSFILLCKKLYSSFLCQLTFPPWIMYLFIPLSLYVFWLARMFFIQQLMHSSAYCVISGGSHLSWQNL